MEKQFIVPKFGEIINERPKNMSYEKYRKLRKEQSLRLKGFDTHLEDGQRVHVRGRLQCACLIPSAEYVNSQNPSVIVR